MIEVSESVTWSLGVVVFIFALTQKRYLCRLPNYGYLAFSYTALLLSWTMTILEGFVLESLFNFLEHSFLLLSAILLAIWCFRAAESLEKTV